MMRSISPATATESAWHYLPVTASLWQRPRSYPPVVQRILLPVQLSYLPDMVVMSVLDFAAKIKMDLILLVIHEEEELDQELLFSTLRGFQAHIQQLGDISLQIDTAVGFNEKTISHYADLYNVDVVILANQLSEFESKKTKEFALFKSSWQPLV